MTTVLSWRSRLAAMDHRHGTSHKMIQDAMSMEIDELRRALAPTIVEQRKVRAAQLRTAKRMCAVNTEVRELRGQVVGLRRALDASLRASDKWKNAGDLQRSLDTVRVSRAAWKKLAAKYRKQLLESKS